MGEHEAGVQGVSCLWCIWWWVRKLVSFDMLASS
jgi:hypothetical protein